VLYFFCTCPGCKGRTTCLTLMRAGAG
jgi:hypothetical protein